MNLKESDNALADVLRSISTLAASPENQTAMADLAAVYQAAQSLRKTYRIAWPYPLLPVVKTVYEFHTPENIAGDRETLLKRIPEVLRDSVGRGLAVLENGNGWATTFLQNGGKPTAYFRDSTKIARHLQKIAKNLGLLEPNWSYHHEAFLSVLAEHDANIQINRGTLEISYDASKMKPTTFDVCVNRFRKNAKAWDLQWKEIESGEGQTRQFEARVDAVRLAVLYVIYTDIILIRDNAYSADKDSALWTDRFSKALALVGSGPAQAMPRKSEIPAYANSLGRMAQEVFEHGANKLLGGFFESLSPSSYAMANGEDIYIMTTTDSVAELSHIERVITAWKVSCKKAKHRVTKKPSIKINVEDKSECCRLFGAFAKWAFAENSTLKTPDRERVAHLCNTPVLYTSFEENFFEPIREKLVERGISLAGVTFKVITDVGPVLQFTVSGIQGLGKAEGRSLINTYDKEDRQIFGPVQDGAPLRITYKYPAYYDTDKTTSMAVEIPRLYYDKEF